MSIRSRTLFHDGNFNPKEPFTFGMKVCRREKKNRVDYVIEIVYTTNERDNGVFYKSYKLIREKPATNFLSNGKIIEYAVSVYKQLQLDISKLGNENGM